MLAQAPVVQAQDQSQAGLSRRAVRAARMLVSSSSYTRASAVARSTPASASTSSVGSVASSSRSVPPWSPLPDRLTAALTMSSSAAEAARARPTTG